MNISKELNKLEQSNDKFENYLQRFTTGDKDIMMRSIEDSFKDVKKSVTKLRKHVLNRE